MSEKINEPVDVVATFNQGPKNTMVVRPYLFRWRGRRYRVETFGLYHPERRGAKRVHIFEFSCEQTAFRLELDPDTLQWLLAEVYYGT